MKAAIYARKSTDDNDKTADNKSVTRQVDHAKKYASSNGWSVDEDHIYIDDGISGAEFRNRPGLLKMLDHLKEFDVIVMSELSRLGREQTQTGSVLANIHSADVKVHFYLTDEELNFDSAIDKFLVNAVAFAAELEREKASQRSRDALKRKAEKGYNTGGRVYGYNNVPVYSTGANGDRVKSHTDYKINEEHRDVILGIYTMYAAGHGMTKIAKALNGDPKYKNQNTKYFGGRRPNAPAHGTKKGVNSWPPSSIRKMLYNDRYVGTVPFGQFRKAYRNGTKVRIKQDEFDKAFRKDLVIVPKALWDRVQKRLAAVRKTYIRDNNGEWWGRPPTGRSSKYLLTGLTRCEVCGASMVANVAYSGPRTKANRKKYLHYVCSHFSNRGTTVCSNNIKPKMAELDKTVVDAIQQSVLSPEAVEYVVRQAMERIKRQQQERPDLPGQLRKEIAKLRLELERFISLIASGKAPDSILQEITTREDRIKLLEKELAECDLPVEMTELDTKRLQKDLRGRMDQFGDLLHDNVPRARQALDKLLDGPIWVKPRASGYELKGQTRLGALLPPTSVTLASPRGFEPLLSP